MNFGRPLGNEVTDSRKKLPVKRQISQETVRDIVKFKIKTLTDDGEKILAVIDSLEL